MLNLIITMGLWMRLLTISWLIWLSAVAAVNSPDISISSPKPSDPVQGVVTIIGTTSLVGFVSSEVDFAYHQNDPVNWFLIEERTNPTSDDTIATWDTSTISDGTYDLRLVVTLADGTQKTVQVRDIRVRNYTAIETSTPLPIITPNQTSLTALSGTAGPHPTSTATPNRPTSTSFPSNPAILSENDFLVSLGKGGLIIGGLFLLAGLYARLKSISRR